MVQIEVLTRTRVEELAPLIHDGFGDKRCCLCLGRDIDDTSQWGLIATLLQGYAAYPDEKIAACGIAVEYPAPGPDDAAGTPTTDTIGTIVGFCQLRLPGMPVDFDTPEWYEGRLAPDEGHIERLVVSGRMRGQGIGTQLLDWAEVTCRNWGSLSDRDTSRVSLDLPADQPLRQPINRISLTVVHGNPARRLYERHGYVAQRQGCCGRLGNIACAYFLMRKCGLNRMVKELETAES
eukprot:COSAG04_NODE_1785_length_5585_cov_461.563799_3_plen_236_part_00